MGVTNNKHRRKLDHQRISWDSRHNNKLDVWISILKRNHTRPKFEVIKEFENYDAAHKFEKQIINRLGNNIFNIKNNG